MSYYFTIILLLNYGVCSIFLVCNILHSVINQILKFTKFYHIITNSLLYDIELYIINYNIII